QITADGLERVDLLEAVLHLVEASELPGRLRDCEPQETPLGTVEPVAAGILDASARERERLDVTAVGLQQPRLVHRRPREVAPRMGFTRDGAGEVQFGETRFDLA